ncbi:hypothetical protein [Rhodococcus jostii]
MAADDVGRAYWRLVFVATRVFANEELARLREFPEISREELF